MFLPKLLGWLHKVSPKTKHGITRCWRRIPLVWAGDGMVPTLTDGHTGWWEARTQCRCPALGDEQRCHTPEHETCGLWNHKAPPSWCVAPVWLYNISGPTRPPLPERDTARAPQDP